jgi:hypothetical protein
MQASECGSMLVFLDYKMTGYELGDTLCFMATLVEEKISTEFINENKKIMPEASAQHHISNAMIKSAGGFADSKILQFLQSLSIEDILVVHDYEVLQRVLARYDLRVYAGIIDTKRVVKHKIEEINRFDLQYLRYELGLYEDENLCYKPDEDIYVVKSLFEYLLEISSQEKMLELSFEPVLLKKINFGKYNGRYVEEIAMSDPRYLEWMLSLETLDGDLRFTIEYYLQKGQL